MTEKQRVEKIIQNYGYADGQFAQEIGIQNSTLSHILNGRNRPSLDVMQKILRRFPEIAPDWLITGQGNMLRKTAQAHTPNLFMDADSSSHPQTEQVPQHSTQFRQADSPSSRVDVRSVDPEPYKQLKETELSSTEDNLKSKIQSVISQQDVQIAINKKVTKIIVYFSDHSFQEFESK